MAFAFLDQLPNSPIVTFTVLLLAVLIVPPVFERLRLPGLVGLLVAGVVLGQDGLRLLDPDTETMKLLSDIGKIYLMFVAGLEIDLAQSRRTRNRSLGFGFATFAVPLSRPRIRHCNVCTPTTLRHCSRSCIWLWVECLRLAGLLDGLPYPAGVSHRATPRRCR